MFRQGLGHLWLCLFSFCCLFFVLGVPPCTYAFSLLKGAKRTDSWQNEHCCQCRLLRSCVEKWAPSPGIRLQSKTIAGSGWFWQVWSWLQCGPAISCLLHPSERWDVSTTKHSRLRCLEGPTLYNTIQSTHRWQTFEAQCKEQCRKQRDVM